MTGRRVTARSGLAAEFATPDGLLAAARALREAGYVELDACTPFPIDGLDEALALARSPLNWLVFPLGMGGAGLGFFILWYCNAYSYVLNVGGRPPFAAAAFVPITFETGILTSALVGFVALFAVCGLPHLSHPLFQLDGFDRASVDRFWLVVGGDDRKLVLPYTVRELEGLGALRVEWFGDRGALT